MLEIKAKVENETVDKLFAKVQENGIVTSNFIDWFIKYNIQM